MGKTKTNNFYKKNSKKDTKKNKNLKRKCKTLKKMLKDKKQSRIHRGGSNKKLTTPDERKELLRQQVKRFDQNSKNSNAKAKLDAFKKILNNAVKANEFKILPGLEPNLPNINNKYTISEAPPSKQNLMNSLSKLNTSFLKQDKEGYLNFINSIKKYLDIPDNDTSYDETIAKYYDEHVEKIEQKNNNALFNTENQEPETRVTQETPGTETGTLGKETVTTGTPVTGIAEKKTQESVQTQVLQEPVVAVKAPTQITPETVLTPETVQMPLTQVTQLIPGPVQMPVVEVKAPTQITQETQETPGPVQKQVTQVIQAPVQMPIVEVKVPTPIINANKQPNVKIVIDSLGIFDDIKMCIDELGWTKYIDAVYARADSNNSTTTRYEYSKTDNISLAFNKNTNNLTYENKKISINNEIQKYGNNKPFIIYIDDNNEINKTSKSIEYGNYVVDLNDYKTTNQIDFINPESIPTNDINCIFIKMERDDVTNSTKKEYLKKLLNFLERYKTIASQKQILIVYDFDCTLTTQHVFKHFNRLNGRVEFINAIAKKTENPLLIEKQLEFYFGDVKSRNAQKDIFEYLKHLFDKVTPEPIKLTEPIKPTEPIKVNLGLIPEVKITPVKEKSVPSKNKYCYI